MKISIITICYNSARTIEDTIISVLNQNYNNIEYIIIDGDSKDETKSIIERYSNFISVYISEPDYGLYDAMNKGIKNSTGDIVAILNSDDVYPDENIISEICKLFDQDQELDILYGNIVYVKNNNLNKMVRYWKSRDYYTNFFEHCNVPPHPSLVIKRHIYNQIGFFNTNYKLAADYDFMFRLFKNYFYNSLYYDRVFVKMRLGGATNKNIFNIIMGNLEIFSIWKSYGITIPINFIPRKIYKRIRQFF